MVSLYKFILSSSCVVLLACLQLKEGDNFEMPNTFYVQGKLKSLELHTKFVNAFLSFLISMHKFRFEIMNFQFRKKIECQKWT